MLKIANLSSLTKDHEGHYIRLDGLSGEHHLQKPAIQRYCYVIVKVWRDGIHVRHISKTGTALISPSKYGQSAEVYPYKEFRLLPFDYDQEERRF